MPSVDTQAVLQFIRMHGPVLPIQLARQINQNSMMAGAVLSELVSSGKLKVSKLKVGGSPLYYPPGQEGRLMSFISHLDPKDRQSYELLRQKGVMKDSALDSLTRVSLRSLKDFAVPVTVSLNSEELNSEEILFWKWYLLSEDQARVQIEHALGMSGQAVSSPPSDQVPEPVGLRSDPQDVGIRSDPQAASPSNPADWVAGKSNSEGLSPAPDAKAHPSGLISGSEYEEERLPSISPTVPEEISKKGVSKTIPDSKKSVVAQPSLSGQRKLLAENTVPEKPVIAEPPLSKPGIAESLLSDPFYQSVVAFLSGKSMVLQAPVCIKKKKEFEGLVSMPSSLGIVTFFCRALNKKRVSDADLSAVFVQSQWHHLPGLLITSGELTKKAKEVAQTRLRGLTVAAMENGG